MINLSILLINICKYNLHHYMAIMNNFIFNSYIRTNQMSNNHVFVKCVIYVLKTFTIIEFVTLKI